MAATGGWRADRIRDTDEVVGWEPVIPVSHERTWAGRAGDQGWVVGEPGRYVLRAGSPAGAIALLPLLERPIEQVAAELGVGDLVEHDLGLERVVLAALECGSGYWASLAIAWLDSGFPAVGCRGGLQRAVSDKRVPQRARQGAARILSREFPAALTQDV